MTGALVPVAATAQTMLTRANGVLMLLVATTVAMLNTTAAMALNKILTKGQQEAGMNKSCSAKPVRASG